MLSLICVYHMLERASGQSPPEQSPPGQSPPGQSTPRQSPLEQKYVLWACPPYGRWLSRGWLSLGVIVQGVIVWGVKVWGVIVLEPLERQNKRVCNEFWTERGWDHITVVTGMTASDKPTRVSIIYQNLLPKNNNYEDSGPGSISSTENH